MKKLLLLFTLFSTLTFSSGSYQPDNPNRVNKIYVKSVISREQDINSELVKLQRNGFKIVEIEVIPHSGYKFGTAFIIYTKK